MNKLLVAMVAVAMLLTAPAGALPTPSPTPSGSVSPSPSPSGSVSPSPSPSGSVSPSPSPSGSVSPSPSGSASPSASPSGSPAPSASPASGSNRAQTFAGTAESTGLRLEIMDNGLTAGFSSATVLSSSTADCAGVACAEAAGAAEPFGTTAVAVAPGNLGPNGMPAFDLGTDASPEFEQALVATLGSSRAAAADTPNRVADADAGAAHLEVTLAQTLIPMLPAELTDGLEMALGAIAEGLAPIADQDPTGTLGGVTDQLTTLVDDLSAAPIATIDLGPSTADATHQGDTTAAFATAVGATIVLVPTPTSTALLPEGLIVIEVGDSNAEAATDATAANADFDPALIRVTLLPGILDAVPDIIIPPEDDEGGGASPTDMIIDQLPEPIQDVLDDILPDDLTLQAAGEEPPPEGGAFLQVPQEGGLVIEITPGQPETCIAEDTPLETCLIAGGGQTTVMGAGSAAVASAASVSALRMDGVGTIELDLATARAGVNAAFVQATPSPTPTPSPSATPSPTRGPLPRTGPPVDLALPAIVVLALSALSLAVLRRRP